MSDPLEKEIEEKLVLMILILARIWQCVRENTDSSKAKMPGLRLKYRDALVSFTNLASVFTDKEAVGKITLRLKEDPRFSLDPDQSKRVFHKLTLDIDSAFLRIDETSGLPEAPSALKKTPLPIPKPAASGINDSVSGSGKDDKLAGGKNKSKAPTAGTAKSQAPGELIDPENEIGKDIEEKVLLSGQGTAEKKKIPIRQTGIDPNTGNINSKDIMRILAENRQVAKQANQRYAKTVLKNLIKVIRQRGPENIEKEIIDKMNQEKKN